MLVTTGRSPDRALGCRERGPSAPLSPGDSPASDHNRGGLQPRWADARRGLSWPPCGSVTRPRAGSSAPSAGTRSQDRGPGVQPRRQAPRLVRPDAVSAEGEVLIWDLTPTPRRAGRPRLVPGHLARPQVQRPGRAVALARRAVAATPQQRRATGAPSASRSAARGLGRLPRGDGAGDAAPGRLRAPRPGHGACRGGATRTGDGSGNDRVSRIRRGLPLSSRDSTSADGDPALRGRGRGPAGLADIRSQLGQDSRITAR